MLETAEMEIENKENSTDNLKTAQENAPAESAESVETFSSELAQTSWSVITYESVAVSGLTYIEAEKWMEKLKVQNILGLCIVTDEAAERVSN